MSNFFTNFSENIINKIIDNKLNVLKSADVYDGVDNKGEIEALSNIRDILTDSIKGNYYIQNEDGKFIKEKSGMSLIEALDTALGSIAVSKYNKKHNTNIPTLQKLTTFIKNLTGIHLPRLEEILEVFVKDEKKREELYKVIKDFTKTTREVFKKISVDLFSTVGNTLAKSSGDFGKYVTAGAQGAANGGGFYGALLAIISQLLSDIIQIVSENSEKFQVFQNFVTLILETFVEQIVPIFDEFVTPFLEGFSAVKEILSGVVYLLGSIIGVFTEIFKASTRELNIIASTVSGIFKFFGGIFQMIRGLIQFLQPVLNVLSYVTRVIATAIYSIEWVIVNGINMIIRALNMLPWVNISEISGFDDYEKGVADIWNADGNTAEDNAYLNAALSQSASNITGASASYTAARDIYVTISYNNSYVNGDSREIALSLYNELKDCKKLNLIS